MSEQATNGQASTDTANADANVTTDSTVATQATGDTANTTDAKATDDVEGKGDDKGGDADGKAPATTTEDDKAKDGKAADDDKNKQDDGKKPGDKAGEAPEDYTFEAPEGVTLDTELVTEFTDIAKELKLSQEDAQKIVDLGPKVMQKFADHQTQIIIDAQTKWAADSKADKEFGGDALDANLAVSKTALDTFGTPELKTLLVESGLGNHPEVIRVFYRIGKGISNDTLVTGKAGATEAKTLASKLYPDHNPT